MIARHAPRPGWVTVASAAADLTKGGDTIDASNVSRYLARNPDVPQERVGKFRFVALEVLRAHRASSLFVADKRQARDIAPPEPPRTAFVQTRDDADDDEAPAQGGSAIQSTNLELKRLDLRKRQREEDIDEGRLVPVEDLQVVVGAMMAAFTAELSREEAKLTAKLGREVGILIRQAHRTARAAAAARLIEAAKEQLHPSAAERLPTDPADPADPSDVEAA